MDPQSDWKARKSTKKRTKLTFNHFITKFIADHKLTDAGKDLRINSIVKESSLEKRRVYDFMNVLVECGICIKVDTHRFLWKGYDFFNDKIREIAIEFEEKALVLPFKEILSLPNSPPIGLLANHFIGCYTYFGTKLLNIREVAILLANDDSKTKPVLRRLYLVAFILEHIGIIKHTENTGDYLFIHSFDVEKAFEMALIELKKKNKIPTMSIYYIINRITTNVRKEVLKERNNTFRKIMSEHSAFLEQAL